MLKNLLLLDRLSYQGTRLTVGKMRNVSTSLMFKSTSDFGCKDSKTGTLSQLRGHYMIYFYFPLFVELSPYHCLSLLYC
jgi:hypothetical protein